MRGEAGFQFQQEDSHPGDDGEKAQVNHLIVIRGRIENSCHLLSIWRNEPEEDFIDPNSQVVKQAADCERTVFFEVTEDVQVLYFKLSDLFKGYP